MEKRRTILERYGIPINHLDFAYIETCENAREMERIVHILRTGEEGYFPDLTKCAENRLKQLKPNSRFFRYEEEIRSRDFLDASDWKPIYDWNNDIKSKDTELEQLKQQDEKETGDGILLNLPPVRRYGKILQSSEKDKEEATQVSNKTKLTPKITDYKKWDKFDADEEILRMDLAEERTNEEVERKNRINQQMSNVAAKSEATSVGPLNDVSVLQKLSSLERGQMAEEYRLRGNDYFRTKEYESAIVEYSNAIRVGPEGGMVAAYNNRAAANMKLQKYLEAIEDCEKCLKLEPNNLKACLRLAESSNRYGRRRESLDLFRRVLELDPTNAMAKKAIEDLRVQLGDLPPASATRMLIEETQAKPLAKPTQKDSTSKTTAIAKKTAASPRKEYDLAKLVVPDRIVKSKLATATEAIKSLTMGGTQSKHGQAKFSNAAKIAEPELRLPMTHELKKPHSRLLIEEI